MRKMIFFFVLIIISCTKDDELKLTIVNFENVEEKYVQFVSSEIQNYFKTDSIQVLKDALPNSAFYEPRQRYRADKLIQYLKENHDAEKIIGLTNKDISTTSGKYEDWGIMGLAYRPGKSCIVSTFRTFSNAKSEEHKKQRIKKVVFHEFGHTLGLPHCENSKNCLMRDAEGKVSTVDEATGFCSKCKSKIQMFLK